MITSEIWFNEKVSSLPDTGRLLFIGIFSNADNEGRLKASPKYLKAHIFPYDDNKTIEEIKQLIDLCANLGLVRLYSKNGQEYLDLPGWYEHQDIRKDRSKPSNLPSINEAEERSVLNQPIRFEYQTPLQEAEHYERTKQHELAERLRSNEWQPTDTTITEVEINKRLGNLYADIVAVTQTGDLILIELKAYPLQPKDLGQVLGYRRELEKRGINQIHTFLIGNGLGRLSAAEAKAVAVTILDMDLCVVPTTSEMLQEQVGLIEGKGGEGRGGEEKGIKPNRIPTVSADQESADQTPKTTKVKSHQKESGAFLSLVEKHEKVPLLSREKLIHLVRTKLFKDVRSTPEKLFECYIWLKENDFFCCNKAPPQVIGAMPDRYPSWLEGKLEPNVGGKGGEYRRYHEKHADGRGDKYEWEEAPGEPDDTS